MAETNPNPEAAQAEVGLYAEELALAKRWVSGEVDWEALPSEVRDAIDEVFKEAAEPVAEEPSVEPTSEPLNELLHKANEEHRFTLGPWYIPQRYDAHGEWTDADELQKALWDYVRTGDRDIRLQHNRDIVAGEWLEALSFPVPVTIGMNKGADASQVTYPAGTVFMGVQWRPWAWELVKEGKIRGFSIGGAAARIEMEMPMEMQKGKTPAEVRWDLVARARVGEVRKQQPTSTQVHVDTIMGGKRKKKRKSRPIMVDKAKTPAWQRKAGQNPKGGLNAKGRASYKRQTGGTLKPPVKRGDNPRRASFLARMGNAPGPEYDEKGEPTRLLLSLRAWGASSKEDARKKARAISARNKSKAQKAKGGLGEWFEEKWVDISRPKEGGGFEECGRPDASEGKYPKCVPASVAAKMSDKERQSAVRRKRRAESSERREGKKPIMVATFKARNMPTDAQLYARVKAEAKKKFDVYPSAYANAWLVQEYKRRGGRYKVVKRSFGGDRSAAGRYAANVRWQRANSGPKGPLPLPRTAAGKRMLDSFGSPISSTSLVTHLDFDALARESKDSGIGPNDPRWGDLVVKHLSTERRMKWIQDINQMVEGVPRNPNGSVVFVKGGGGASGKSTSGGLDTPVAVPPTKGNKDGLPPAAVMVNSDDWKVQSDDFRSLHDSAMRDADREIVRAKVKADSPEADEIRRQVMERRAAAGFVHEESSLIARLATQVAILRQRDVIVDGTMDNGVEKRMAELRMMRGFGATAIHGLFFSCDTEEAVRRAKNREKDRGSDSYGRVVYEKHLREAHQKVSANFPQYIDADVFDSVAVFDTNQRPSRLMGRKEVGGKFEVVDEELYGRFLKKAEGQ